MNEAMSGLMAGGGVSAKLEKVGDTIEGVVMSIERRQDQDMATQQPKTWPNGDPVYVYLIQLETEQRDPSVPEDDGVRTLWCRNNLIRSVREAFRGAGLDGNSSPIGGKLKVRFDSVEKPKQRGHNGAKLYKAKFEKAPPKSDDWDEPGAETGPQTETQQPMSDETIPF